MKRILVVVMVATLLAGSIAIAEAGKKKKKRGRKPVKISRQAESSYESPAIGHPDAIAGCLGSNGCARFAIDSKESFISLKITDATGLPVYALGGQDLNGDNLADTRFTICGETTESISVEPGYELVLFISAAGGTSPPCAGAATSGTVAAIISNSP